MACDERKIKKRSSLMFRAWFSVQAAARWFVVVFCGSTAVSLLFFFDRSVTQFSPTGTAPSWLVAGGGLSAVRLASHVYASLLVFFALNNLLRLFELKKAFGCFGVSLLLVARSLYALSCTSPLLVEPYVSVTCVFS